MIYKTVKFLKSFLIGIILSVLVFVGLVALLILTLNLAPGPKGDDIGKAYTYIIGIYISAGISLVTFIGSIYVGLRTQSGRMSSGTYSVKDKIFNKKMFLIVLLILVLVVYKIFS